MTVGNLKAILDCYDDEQKIVIGEYQPGYGSNFVYNICNDVEENGINKFYGKSIKDGVVMLILGNQIGTIKQYDDEDDNEDFEDENFE